MIEDTASIWAMGGYGSYVWPVYGLAGLFIVGFALHGFLAWRRARRDWDRHQWSQRQSNTDTQTRS